MSHSSESRSSSLLLPSGRRSDLSPSPQPLNSLFTSQSPSSGLHSSTRIDLEKARPWGTHPFVKNHSLDQKSPIEICWCRKPQHTPLDCAWFCKVVLQSFENFCFLTRVGEFRHVVIHGIIAQPIHCFADCDLARCFNRCRSLLSRRSTCLPRTSIPHNSLLPTLQTCPPLQWHWRTLPSSGWHCHPRRIARTA